MRKKRTVGPTSSEVWRSATSDGCGSHRRLIRRPHASANCAMTSIVARTSPRSRWPLTACRPGLAVSDNALRPRKIRASSLRRRHAFACVSAFVARDRPVAPNQSAGHGHHGHTRHDRPDITILARRAPLLRFRVPFSTHRPRRALVPKAAGLRPCPAPAFCARLVARASEPRTLRSTNASPLRFSALPARSSRRRSIRRTRSGPVLRSRII